MANVIFKKGTGTLPLGSVEGTLYFNTSTGKVVLDLEDNDNATSSSRITLNAEQADQLGSSTIGSITQPIYLNGGVPASCSYTLASSVPANAVFSANAVGTAGYVAAPSAVTDINKVWRTDDNGNPSWGNFPSGNGYDIGYITNDKNYAVQVSDNKMYVNVPWTNVNSNYFLNSNVQNKIITTDMINNNTKVPTIKQIIDYLSSIITIPLQSVTITSSLSLVRTKKGTGYNNVSDVINLYKHPSNSAGSNIVWKVSDAIEMLEDPSPTSLKASISGNGTSATITTLGQLSNWPVGNVYVQVVVDNISSNILTVNISNYGDSSSSSM